MADVLSTAREAVAIGAKLLAGADRGTIHHKGDRDTVTDLDLRIQDDIRRYLSIETPEIGFLGEEDDGAGRIPAGAVWVLDPIDGTANFTHGIPLCAVSLALVHDGEPVVGVIAAPFLGTAYVAARGRGSYGNGVRLGVSAVHDLAEAIVSIGDYAVGESAATKNPRRFATTAALAERVERVRMVGSAALDLAWVAEGRLDGCVLLTNQPWDTAAGILVAREAGAIVTDTAGRPHDFAALETVAATPAIAGDLLGLIAR